MCILYHDRVRFTFIMYFAMFYCDVLRLSVKEWKMHKMKNDKKESRFEMHSLHIFAYHAYGPFVHPSFAVVHFPSFLLMKCVFDMLVLES